MPLVSVINSAHVARGLWAVTPTITLTTPTRYTVRQRSNATQGSISITGTYTGSPTAIEASFNGGAYATIDAAPAGGNFSGTLTGQSVGQGTLTVRFTNITTVTASVLDVGIGDVIAIAGQSNAVGIGTNNQSWSHASLKATRYQGTSLGWSLLADPTNSEDGSAAGSPWPLLATTIMASTGVPVAFVSGPPVSGTGIVSWREGNGSGRYESLRNRINAVGGVAVVLWHQGENDAQDGMSAATYTTQLTGLANELFADTGAKIIPALLQDSTFINNTNEGNIRTGITNAVGGNVLSPADLSGLTSDDNFHLQSNANLQAARDAWWSAIQTAGVLPS